MSWIGKVVVICPEMGGGYDLRDEGEIWTEEYSTREEAEAFVQYWKSVSDSYKDHPQNGLIFLEGSVNESTVIDG